MKHRYDAQAVARLEKLYSSPQVIEQRRQLREIIAARSGEAGLDVGCGVGYLACELAREVAPQGRIAAIDNSADAVKAATGRVAREGFEGRVELRAADAAELPFPEASFDFVVAAQVYCYVADVARALAQAARVLRKGGRLVILDSDWDMCLWHSADAARTRRMIAARAAVRFAHADLPRKLHGLLREAGMALSRVQAFAMVETRYDADSFGAGLVDSVGSAALKQGIAPAEVAAWQQDLRSRTADGEWFFSLNRFVFTAVK